MRVPILATLQLYKLLVVLNLIDLSMTLAALALGFGREGNPLLAPLVGFPVLFFLVKLAFVFLYVGLCRALRRWELERPALWVLVLIYLFTVGNNCYAVLSSGNVLLIGVSSVLLVCGWYGVTAGGLELARSVLASRRVWLTAGCFVLAFYLGVVPGVLSSPSVDLSRLVLFLVVAAVLSLAAGRAFASGP